MIEPIAISIQVTAAKTTFAGVGETAQLVATATMPDGTTKDVTAQSTGTTYRTSNPVIATVSADGLVTSVGTGTAVITAQNEGVLAAIFITVAIGADADGDGMPDSYELANGLNPNFGGDAAQDPDGDGLTNLQEFQRGTLPFVADTDGDGLKDGEEVARGTNPLNPDTDGNGLLDGDEVARGTNPLNRDTDGDGLPDGVEVRLGLNPLSTDSNGNGIPDGLEDSDGDGLSNLDELRLGTDPGNPDTDGDGIPDGQEVASGQDPLTKETIPPIVAVRNPSSGATLVQGQTITVAVEATDNGRVASVEIAVNGQTFTTDTTSPYELTFTVPYGVSALTFGATARDVAGNVGTAPAVMVSVITDPLTTVQGTVVDKQAVAVVGANVAVKLNGLKGEFFDFNTPLASFPDLSGRTPDVVKLVSAVNFRNPNRLFNTDTFGIGLGSDFAARFSGLLKLEAPGIYTFTLGAEGGARLLVNGIAVGEVAVSNRFTEATGTVSLPAGNLPLEVQYFQNLGNAELQLSFSSVTATSGENRIVPPALLLQSPDRFTAVTGSGGSYSVANVPTNLGNLRVAAAATVSSIPLTGQSAEVAAVRGGVTNVAAIELRKILFASISAGESHACGVTTSGAAYCWGSNGSGRLGNGTFGGSSIPVLVAGGLTWAQVSAGGNYTCGITTSGAAYCWGDNFFGQLGNGTTNLSNVPVPVSGGLTFAAVSANGHSCGLTTTGAVYCWGANGSGQLGNGTLTSSTTPVAVAGGLTFTSVQAGTAYTCAVTTGNLAYCWGSNAAGKLGNPTLTQSNTPLAVAGGFSFASVSAGNNHTCGVTPSGAAYCWGGNNFGQLGIGSTVNNLTPAPVSGGLSFAAVSAGGPNSAVGGTGSHSCGVTTGGPAYCWGYNGFGGLGTGTFTGSTVPVPVTSGLAFASVSAGGAYTCGLTTSNAAYCWGLNAPGGQLGIGSSGFATNTPGRVSDPP